MWLIQSLIVIGMEVMERIMIVRRWSNLRENWLIRVMSSVIPALEAMFRKSVMYVWNPSLVVLLDVFADFCTSLESFRQTVALVSKG